MRAVKWLGVSAGLITAALGASGCDRSRHAERGILTQETPATPRADSGRVPIIQLIQSSLPPAGTTIKLAGSEVSSTLSRSRPVSFRVRRDTVVEGGDYAFAAGPVTGDPLKTFRLELDRSDFPYLGDDGRASVAVIQGWAMIARPSGFPPLRTIRTTTGRPYNLDALIVPPVAKLDACEPNGQPYEMLLVVEPESSACKGVEYYFMSKRPLAQSFWMQSLGECPDQRAQTFRCISSGQYVTFDRSTGAWECPKDLPTMAQLQEFPRWVRDAVCAAESTPTIAGVAISTALFHDGPGPCR